MAFGMDSIHRRAAARREKTGGLSISATLTWNVQAALRGGAALSSPAPDHIRARALLFGGCPSEFARQRVDRSSSGGAGSRLKLKICAGSSDRWLGLCNGRSRLHQPNHRRWRTGRGTIDFAHDDRDVLEVGSRGVPLSVARIVKAYSPGPSASDVCQLKAPVRRDQRIGWGSGQAKDELLAQVDVGGGAVN